MKNNRPIILNCFSRGGSNILWNILLSHPDVCSPIQETLEIFRLDWRDLRKKGLQAAWMTHQWNYFDQWNFYERKPISHAANDFIDDTFFQWKLKTLADDEMRYKTSDALYTRTEVENARLVLKNNNGTIFLSRQFTEMYPGAVFFALVRDPIPLYESHKRNKTPVSASPERFAAFYETMVKKMQSDAESWNFYHILRFEDILRKPVLSIQKVYDLAGLDISKVPQMRFKAKPHMQANGQHTTRFERGRHHWFSFDDIPQLLEPQVNEYQTSRLSQKEIGELRTLTRDMRGQFGYLDDGR